MKLPTVKGRQWHYPKKALCPWCLKNKIFEPHSFAILGGGALLMDRKDKSGGPDENMDGFLHISWHGAHWGGKGRDKEISETVNIAKDVKGGQFDLYFCSTKCLRAYLNFCVDNLEKRIKSARPRSNKRLHRIADKSGSR